MSTTVRNFTPSGPGMQGWYIEDSVYAQRGRELTGLTIGGVAFGLWRGLMQAAMSKERGGIRVATTEVSEHVHRVRSSTQGQYGVSV